MDIEFSATQNSKGIISETNFQVVEICSSPKTEAQLNLDIRENKLSQEEIDKAREANKANKIEMRIFQFLYNDFISH